MQLSCSDLFHFIRMTCHDTPIFKYNAHIQKVSAQTEENDFLPRYFFQYLFYLLSNMSRDSSLCHRLEKFIFGGSFEMILIMREAMHRKVFESLEFAEGISKEAAFLVRIFYVYLCTCSKLEHWCYYTLNSVTMSGHV